MKVIVGLGNPGMKYAKTRHNVGFLALDFYLRDMQTISCSSRFHGQICEVHFTLSGNPIPVKTFFIKPQTYMNKSGDAVAEIVSYYKLQPETDLLIVHDEIDLKFGYSKTAFGSRPAGHNGVKSIIASLGTQKFHRLRIGVESRKSRLESPTDEYVLSPFSTDELATLESDVFPKAALVMQEFIAS